jgi:hypothetical protein
MPAGIRRHEMSVLTIAITPAIEAAAGGGAPRAVGFSAMSDWPGPPERLSKPIPGGTFRYGGAVLLVSRCPTLGHRHDSVTEPTALP